MSNLRLKNIAKNLWFIDGSQFNSTEVRKGVRV